MNLRMPNKFQSWICWGGCLKFKPCFVTFVFENKIFLYFTSLLSNHYDIIMSAMASEITSLTIIYSTAKSNKTSILRVTSLCDGNSPVNSPLKGPVTRNSFSNWWRHDVLKHHGLLAFLPLEDNDINIAHSGYHGLWWHGDRRRLSINSHV